jgi:hypothetical protein
MLYGALRYDNSCNLGDNIQSIAAIKFLPKVDYWIDRDTGNNSYVGSEKIITIYNGWFNEMLWRTLPQNVDPIFISFHLNHQTYSTDKRYKSLFEKFSISRNIENLKRMKEPVGCRDISTLEYLKENKIQSFFSGCLTLTLEKPDIKSTDNVVIIDVDQSIPWVNNIKNKIVKSQVSLLDTKDNSGKILEAKKLLETIASGKFVITSRLHTLLPAIAFEVPVILVPDDAKDIRFTGLIDGSIVPIADRENCSVDLDHFSWDYMTKNYNVAFLKTLAGRLAKNVISQLNHKRFISKN